MKLIIFIILAYIGYRFLKSWTFRHLGLQNKFPGRNADQIDDIMVKDPFCQVHFPKRQGIHLQVRGKDLFFCSEECRNRFIESNP